MIKKFYAVEVTIMEVTADVNDFDVNIGGKPPLREDLGSYYRGDLSSETKALALFDQLVAVLRQGKP